MLPHPKNGHFFPANWLQQKRLDADPPADETVTALLQAGQHDMLYRWGDAVVYNRDLVPDTFPDALKHYLATTRHPPVSVQWRRVGRGHRFFAAHAPAILSILGCLSLPYCYAAADGAQVLWLSRRIRNDTRQRLVETAQFLLDVMAPDAFLPGGKGIRSIQKVRLIHAVARYYARRSPQWNMQWGLPVNQEDLAATNLAFSYVVLQGLQKLGVAWRKAEAEDFLYVWNLIGQMLGVDTALLPADLQQAYWLDKTITGRHFRTSEAGVGLTHALLDSLGEINREAAMSRTFLEAYMRYLLGDAVADLLHVPAASSGNHLLPAFRSANVLAAALAQWAPADPQRVTNTLQRELQRQAATQFRVPDAFE